MSRRKQQHPLHLDTLDQLSNLLEHGEEDGGTGDEHVCGKCRLEFIDLSDFLHHKRSCTRKRLVLVGGSEDSSDDLDDTDELESPPEDFKDDPEKYAEDITNIPYVMSLSSVKACFPENPALPVKGSFTESEDHPPEPDNDAKSTIYNNFSEDSIPNEIKKGSVEAASSPNPQTLPQYLLMQAVPDTNVTLQALQNTRVAVAQQGAANPNLNHLALHTALYTLQQQQIIQLHQVIQQLQSQLVGSTPPSATNPTLPSIPTVGTLTGSAALTPPQSTDGNNGGLPATVTPLRTVETITQAQNLSVTTTATTTSTTNDNPITATSVQPPPPPHEPNTLELLQRHTEQALQNTMAGSSFLLNGLSGMGNSSDILRFCKKGDVKKEGSEEAFFRHRCRFCGKVFGSDSALQIHIRSHTGERPFKCNVCGNRFSTKGNLKVHFGRHKEKYPHIKMNPHPVPLHLDNLHPPLEPPEASETPPILTQGSPCQTIALSLQPPNLVPAQPLPLVTHYYDRGLSSPTNNQEMGRQSDNENAQLERRSVSPNDASNLSDDSGGSVGEDYAIDENGVKDTDQARYDEDIEDNDDDSFSASPKIEQKETDDNADEDMKTPTSENNGSMRITTSIPSYVSSSAPTFPYFFHPNLSPPSSMASICYPPMSTPPLTSTPSSRVSTTSNTNNDGKEQGPSPDPNFYQDLLPKPGSNDNSWESLMEVTKTSETSKLQQLVDNIEHKLSDPNQCLFCHRVLSCKSALQMHYRTHTGERPFKCKICSRAFTTKGNLKTHMGVHRSKSSLQVLHQCPVCHKQFTNSLVLQQHIRMHTGEPTDMHPEQIMANEVRQGHHLLTTSFPRPVMPSLLPTFTSPPSLPPRSSPGGPPNLCQTPKSSEAASLTPSPVHSSTPTESVIKTTLKQSDNHSMDESSSPTTIGNSSRSPPAKQERCATPQPPVLTSNSPLSVDNNASTPPQISSPNMDKPIISTPYSPAYTTSLVALENHVKAINTTIPQTLPFSPFGMGLAMGSFFRYEDTAFMNRNQSKDIHREKSPVPPQSYSPSPNTSRAGSDISDERSTPGSMIKSESPVSVNGNHIRLSSGVITPKIEGGALDLTPKNSNISIPPSTPDIQLFPSPLAGLPFPTTPGRLSTTCRICFKTFACNSALEIHYRSHTKERPFKCNVCDRGFTTKGNMKQHLLTHKSRDLQPLLFASTDNSVPDSETNSSTNVTSPRTSSPVTAFETNLSQTSSHHSEKKEPVVSTVSTISPPLSTATAIISTSSQIAPPPLPLPPPVVSCAPLPKSIKVENDGTQKRHNLDQPSAPPSKRTSGFPKHFCHICQKPFSSASALQIHNRTHSGEKPFKCVVCGRAFTTKGNLKVHMNTHMAQSNGNSRRGRRMSLEFQPPPLPAHGKQDYPHHARPELYFPYLPPGYINGITCPPKMNEISVIQSAAGFTNGNISTSNTMSLTPAVSMMTPVMTLGQQQPFIRKQVQQSADTDGNHYVDPRSPDEAENLKIQPSPSPPMESASPVRPIPSSPSAASDNAACWSWKTACNVCNKICASSTELEIHLKSHCSSAIHDAVRSTAKNLAS